MSDIVRQVASGYAAGVGHEPDADWELRFGHTVGYASTYYSYVQNACVFHTSPPRAFGPFFTAAWRTALKNIELGSRRPSPRGSECAPSARILEPAS